MDDNLNSCLKYNALNSLDKSSANKKENVLYHENDHDQKKYFFKIFDDTKKTNNIQISYHAFTKEISELNNKIEVLTKERNGLRQQCSSAIQQRDEILRENNETKKQLSQTQQQLDETVKKTNQETSHRLKVTRDLARLTEERNSAIQEYNLIMSERDSVHKEMEKLHEELNDCQKKLKTSDLNKNDLLKEIESLKREVNDVTNRNFDKDFLMKNKFKEKYDYPFYSVNNFHNGFKSNSKNINSSNNNGNKWGSSSSGISTSWTPCKNLKNQFSISSTNSNISSQVFNNDFKHKTTSNSSCLSVLGNKMLNKSESIDNESELRKHIQSLEHESNNLQKEFQRCLLENEKVIQERESFKTYCDKLRRERDRAIRDLAEALRDLDDFRQKIEFNNQTKKYVENLNELNVPDSNNKQPLFIDDSTKSLNMSTTSQDDDYDNLKIVLSNGLDKRSDKNPWGFDFEVKNKCFVVTNIACGSSAENSLKVDDIILSVNSNSIKNESNLNELLNKHEKDVHLIVKRRKNNNSVFYVNLNISDNQHGLIIENNFYIKKILPNSSAAKLKNLKVGDCLLEINGIDLNILNINDVMQLLDNQNSNFSLKLVRKSLKNQNFSDCISQLSENSCNNQLDFTKNKFNLKLNQNSNYSPNYSHYQSIKRSSKKSKNLLNVSQFAIESDKFSSTLFDKAYNKIFKKSIKSKSDKKDEKSKKCLEKETLEDFNKMLNNLSENETNKHLNDYYEKTDKNNGGTWPSCKSNNHSGSPIYGKIKPISNTYSRKKERKSLAVFSNYSKINNKNSLLEMMNSNSKVLSNYNRGSADNSKENRLNSDQEDKSYFEFNKDLKNFNDYQYINNYLIQKNKTSSRGNTPNLDSSNKSLIQVKNIEKNLSSSISSYSSTPKENYKSNSKKYTINHEIPYKNFNSSNHLEQDYLMKKFKEKMFLDYFKNNNSALNKHSNLIESKGLDSSQNNRFIQNSQSFNLNFNGELLNSQNNSLYYQNNSDKNSKETLQSSQNLNYSLGLYSAKKNKRSLISNNFNNYPSSNYQSLDIYANYSSNIPVDQLKYSYTNFSEKNNSNEANFINRDSLLGFNNLSLENENLNDQFYIQNNIDGQTSSEKKSSPININQFKTINRLPVTAGSPSTSFQLNDHLNNSSNYATFSNSQSNPKENYYFFTNQLSSLKNQSNYNEKSNQFVKTNNNQSSLSYNSSSLISSNQNNSKENNYFNNIYEDSNQKNVQNFYVSSNNSFASKLSNNSIDNNLTQSNISNSSQLKSSNDFNNIDNSIYSNIQNLKLNSPLGIEILNKNKGVSDKKQIPNNNKKLILATDDEKNYPKSISELNESKNEKIKSIGDGNQNYQDKDKNSLKMFLNTKDINLEKLSKTENIRTIYIDNPKEKSLGIQIASGTQIENLPYPGIFISHVNEDSLAVEKGLQVGDQLLEVCGINMCMANYEAASRLLRQCCNQPSAQPLVIKVQFNPEKFYGKNLFKQILSNERIDLVNKIKDLDQKKYIIENSLNEQFSDDVIKKEIDEKNCKEQLLDEKENYLKREFKINSENELRSLDLNKNSFDSNSIDKENNFSEKGLYF